MTGARWAQGAILSAALLAGAAYAQRQPLGEAEVEVGRVEGALKAAADRLALVEREYGQLEDPSELLELRRRYSEGETQSLLGEYANAAALLYDVVDSPVYRAEETRPDALLYLADALFKQGSWLESRRYFRELAELRIPRHLQESLLKLIELSDKVGDQTGIDDLYRALIEQAGSPDRLKPEVVYVHAKWLARRPDLADKERIGRALDAFRQIPDGSEYGPQARYFEGALLVQQGALEEAAAGFERVLALPQIAQAPSDSEVSRLSQDLRGEAAVKAAHAARFARLRDLSLLALGRVYFERANYSKAIERYQQLARESESYSEALYEISASWMKLGEFEKALRATELLLLLVEDSTIAPEARLQQAALQLRLKHYAKAQQQFEALAGEFRPVRERIDALTSREDPVTYYNDLLERGERSLDTTQLLPEVARRYVGGRDAGHARVIIGELSAGRVGLDESRVILERLNAALAAGKLELFPTLQEGNVRAVEVENALLRIEGQLIGVETRLIEGGAPAAGSALAQARQDRQALDAKVAELPDTAEAIEERRTKTQAQVTELDKLAFKLGVEIDSLNAQLIAVEKWRRDTAGERKGAARAEQEFAAQVEGDRAVVGQLEKERQQILRALGVARAGATAAVSGGPGEDRLRAAYLRVVEEEKSAARAAQDQLTPVQRIFAARIDADMAAVGGLRRRTLAVRQSIKERAKGKLLALRLRVDREARALGGYGGEVGDIEGGTKQLLGRIAFESFARVGRIFYDLVLKADLGVIDAAWTQKKERTESITSLEEEKQKNLKALAEEFAEVLREVE